ncbi:hypothetical protein X760_11030 [Mesorhizobium sp. LSHC422A00]|nr:hypothetical protein X760_11030 [Mesorhizobium sp. LSHC422A00]
MPLLISVIARQTTGSIFRAWRKDDVDASRLQVPLKIIEILDDGDIEEIAPRISQSANNQNKVDMADFSSNHPSTDGCRSFRVDLGAPGGRYATSVTLVLRTCAR